VSRPRVAIVGGGPAGAAVALSLARGRPTAEIALFDAGGGEDGIKIGETVPGAATPVLARLGASAALTDIAHLPCPGGIAVWGSDRPGHNDSWTHLDGRAYHLDRNAFDAALLHRVEAAGIAVHAGHRLRGVAWRDTALLLRFTLDGGGETTVCADRVVDASGPAGVVARRLGIYRNVLDDLLSLSAIVDLPPGHDVPGRTLLEAVPEGWWYAARLPGELAILSFFTDQWTLADRDPRVPTDWQTLFRETRWLRGRFPPAIAGTAPARIHIRAAGSHLLSEVVGDRWLAVGDAASRYDPITSAGITKSLLQGEAAGDALARHLADGGDAPLSVYRETVFRDFERYAALRRHLYDLETRFQNEPFWRRRRGLDRSAGRYSASSS